MNIELYTRADCSKCITLKDILHRLSVEYTEYIIDSNISRDEVISKFPNQSRLPIVVYESVVLADGDQLVKIIMEKKYNDNSS